MEIINKNNKQAYLIIADPVWQHAAVSQGLQSPPVHSNSDKYNAGNLHPCQIHNLLGVLFINLSPFLAHDKLGQCRATCEGDPHTCLWHQGFEQHERHLFGNCNRMLLPTADESALVQKQRRQLTGCFACRTWGALILHRKEFISKDHWQCKRMKASLTAANHTDRDGRV